MLGSTTAVAGLLLVFQGYLFSVYSGFPSDTPAKVKRPYKIGVLSIVVVLAVTLLVALGAVMWLLGVNLFWVTVGGFLLVLALLLVVSVAATVLILE